MDFQAMVAARKKYEDEISQKPKFKYVTNLLGTVTKDIGADNLFSCNTCKRTFHNQFYFVSHIQEIHEKDPINLKFTRICGGLCISHDTDGEKLKLTDL